jgi:hypothetical protein
VAPSSVGADAHADHESTAGVGHERGLSLEEKTVQRARTSTVGVRTGVAMIDSPSRRTLAIRFNCR